MTHSAYRVYTGVVNAWADDQLAALKAAFPGFDIWYVRWLGVGYSWHARPAGAPKATLNADSPDELAEQIQAQE